MQRSVAYIVGGAAVSVSTDNTPDGDTKRRGSAAAGLHGNGGVGNGLPVKGGQQVLPVGISIGIGAAWVFFRDSLGIFLCKEFLQVQEYMLKCNVSSKVNKYRRTNE